MSGCAYKIEMCVPSIPKRSPRGNVFRVFVKQRNETLLQTLSVEKQLYSYEMVANSIITITEFEKKRVLKTNLVIYFTVLS